VSGRDTLGWKRKEMPERERTTQRKVEAAWFGCEETVGYIEDDED
jgi:hypothetical protein